MFGSFFRAAGRAIGRGVEKVGNMIGSERLSSAGRSIQDACAERVSSERSYNKREANIYTTDRLNEILTSFSSGYLQQATAIEKNCIHLVEQYYDHLIHVIENVPNGVHSSANLRALKNGKSRISKTITGGIKDPLAKRMSLDDAECLRILKMDAGNEKKQAMTNFTQKVIHEAVNNLAKKVREALTDQTEDIQDYLCSISEEQEKAMQALKEQFDKFAQTNELEKNEWEKNCINPLYMIDAADSINNILKNDIRG